MTPRYISTTYSVPSGAFASHTGRKRSSVEARNSRPIVGAARPQRRAVVADDQPPNEIAGRLGKERIAVQLGRETVATIDRR